MTVARTLGWACAALLVLGGHGAGALWMMQVRPAPPEPPGEAIFVDLAPPPPAPDFTVPESGLPRLEPLTELPRPESPDFSVPPAPFEPLPPLTGIAAADIASPDFVPPDIAPLPPLDAAALRPVAAARPQPRPDPPRPEKPEKPERDKPRNPAKAEARPEDTARPERAQATAAQKQRGSTPRASAVSGSAKGAGARAQQSWRSTASAAVARHMQRGRYSTRVPVAATIRLSVAGSGRITAASASSGEGGALDAALNRQIRRLGRLPAPPGGQPLSVVVPVRISR